MIFHLKNVSKNVRIICQIPIRGVVGAGVVGGPVVVGIGVVVTDAVVAGGKVVTLAVVGWLVGPCVVPGRVNQSLLVVRLVAGGGFVTKGFVTGSALSKLHTPLIHAPFPLLQCVPSDTSPLGR